MQSILSGRLEKISSISFSPDAMQMDCQNIFTNTNLKMISFEVGIFEKITPFGFVVILKGKGECEITVEATTILYLI